MKKEVLEFADKVVGLGALSVFLYGSRARGDALEESDWELEAIFKDGKCRSRSELAKLAPEGVVIYPYEITEFESGNFEIPFTKSIWLNEVIRTGKTIAGQRILETQTPPKITKDDLRADISFYKARALDAMIAQRNDERKTAKDAFVKSCLLGLRVLILVSGGAFPQGYEEIAKKAAKHLPEKYADLPKSALDVRTGSKELTLDLTFLNIGLFTEVLEPRVK